MLKQLILYDLDGTLVDTSDDIVQAAQYTLRQLALPALPREVILRGVGRGLEQLIAGCLQTTDAKRIQAGMTIYRGYYAQHLLDRSALYPGAQECLEYFRARKQAVITNKPNPFSRDILAGLGVVGYFFEILAGDSAYPNKPDPSGVASMMRHLCVSSLETLFIGDSPIDVQTGRNAGVDTVVVRHGFAEDDEIARMRPDVVVEDFQELLELAKERRW